MLVQFDNTIPIYVQIIDDIKSDIISGKLSPGDKLPSVREYSEIYKVNPNTMQKALADLEDMNLIYTQRTNGKFVTHDIKIINKYKDDYIKGIITKYFNDMENISVNKEDAIKYIIGKGEVK